MSFYVDTSAIVAALTPEAATVRVQAWLSERAAGELAISGSVVAEVSSALAMKVRARMLDLEQRAAILTHWRRLVEESLVVESVSAGDFEVAALLVDQAELGLRAADALHLAIASGRGRCLATLDVALAKAGPPLGIGTLLL